MLQVRRLSDEVAKCPRLKVLRLEENCLELSAFSPAILRDSNISLLALDGNLFDTKQFRDLEGYDQVGVQLLGFIPGLWIRYLRVVIKANKMANDLFYYITFLSKINKPNNNLITCITTKYVVS